MWISVCGIGQVQHSRIWLAYCLYPRTVFANDCLQVWQTTFVVTEIEAEAVRVRTPDYSNT